MWFKWQTLYLVLVMGTSFSSLVSGKANNLVVVQAKTSSSVSTAAPSSKPTTAPLLTSTPRPLMNAGMPAPAPTKAPNMILNTPPKITGEKKLERLQSAEQSKMAMSTPTPLQAPPTDAELKSEAGSVKPLQVTGFITKNGNIYEVQDKDGVGLIEGRQSPETEKESHVCNYGSVVIYSDVPCDQVTNVRIGEVQHTVINTAGPDPVAAPEQPQQEPQIRPEPEVPVSENSTENNNDDNEIPDFDEDTGPVRQPARRRGNKNNANRRRNGGNRKLQNNLRQGGHRNGQGSNRRPFREPQQQRRRQQFNRNQNQQQRRRQQQQRRRNQNSNNYRNKPRRQNQRGQGNRRPFDYYDDEER